MKITNYLVAAAITLTSFSSIGQTQNVNTEKSSITWLGKKIGGQHEGTIQIKSGSIYLSENKIDSGSFIIDMNSMDCTELMGKKLVGHLKSDDFFGVDKFPEAVLKITKASEITDGKASITGDITIKGKTESITFEAAKKENSFIATLDIDRTKFDVRYGSKSFFDNLGNKAIDDIFTLKIELIVD